MLGPGKDADLDQELDNNSNVYVYVYLDQKGGLRVMILIKKKALKPIETLSYYIKLHVCLSVCVCIC